MQKLSMEQMAPQRCTRRRRSRSTECQPLFCLFLVVLHNSCMAGSAFTPCGQIAPHRHVSILSARGRSAKTTLEMPNIPAFSPGSNPSVDAAPQMSTMVVLDVENIRGANAFRISHEALMTRIRMWREDRLFRSQTSTLEPMIWVCDHGVSSSIHYLSSSPQEDGVDYNGAKVKLPNNLGVAFSGLRTADDVIVDLVKLRCGDDTQSVLSRNTTIIITADAKLISRCQIARRESSSLSDLIFVEPSSLLQQLEVYKLNTHEEEGLFGEFHQNVRPIQRANLGEFERRSDGKTNSMTSFKDSSIAMEQHARFQARFQNKEKLAVTASNQLTDGEKSARDSNMEESKIIQPDNDAAMIAKLKTEQIRRQMLASDAFYLARPSKMRGRKSSSTVAAIHAKYKDRNISKKQQKRLIKRRFGRQRNEEMAKAATTRKELAKKLQNHLENLSAESFGICQSVSGESECLLHTLLGWFEEEHPKCNNIYDDAHHDELEGLPIHRSGGSSGNFESDGSWNPLGSVLRTPLRDASLETNLAPLRLVVISDTHGFEGALAKFDESQKHTNDYLLPQADLLIHCGDFAASGSRKNQRAAGRRLDEWLARQTHIPEKIVIKGNHDPDSPPKVIFPRSKALYVRASSTLVVNGVTFALEPYTRRMSLRSMRKQLLPAESQLQPCDVLVTHEPPKGVLDLTYHGFTAGSSFLRNLVDNARVKPRLWLCGHIHEGRGILTKKFNTNIEDGHDDTGSTIVVNAANANSGKANRLVSGAVVIDVERTHVDESQTAKNTIQLRQTEDEVISQEDLAGIDNMTQYVTRPGVRRRKGIPRRQLLK